MSEIELGAVQERFADIVWAHEPIASGGLVELCKKELNWKKTDYLHRAAEAVRKGAFRKPQRDRHVAHSARDVLRGTEHKGTVLLCFGKRRYDAGEQHRRTVPLCSESH